jgi:hypothetical protein
VGANGRENIETGPVARIVAPPAKKVRKPVARRADFRRRTADGVRAHQRSRSLSEGAGADLLPERGDPPVSVYRNVDANSAAANGGTAFGAGRRAPQATFVRDRRRESQDGRGVKRRLYRHSEPPKVTTKSHQTKGVGARHGGGGGEERPAGRRRAGIMDRR